MYRHHIFRIVLSLLLRFCRVDLSSHTVSIVLLKREASNILSQTYLNSAVTSEISLLVHVIFPAGSTFPAKVIGRILTEGLGPLNIHLSKTCRDGYFRVTFKNENILRDFFLHRLFPEPVILGPNKPDPVQIQFSFERVPCECCDKTLTGCLISSLQNLGIEIIPIPKTGVFTCQFPSSESLFVAFMGLYQNLGSPLSI